MAIAQITDVLRHLRRIHLSTEHRNLNDGQLLERFYQHNDQTAFEVLVQRYGSMVLGVCHRLLRNNHDTEDAFQAVFLVVVHKSHGLRGRESIGNWLYGVAYHTALKARAMSVLRRSKENKVTARMNDQPMEADELARLRSVLDQELNRLSDTLREAVVLCEVLGKSRKDAAEQLGIPEGTLSSRLAAARRRLAKQLKLQGIAVSCATLTIGSCLNTASAYVTPQLVARTVEAASVVATGAVVAGGIVSPAGVALTEGVLQSMFIAKCKSAMVAALGVVLITLGAVGVCAIASSQDGKKSDVTPIADRRVAKEKSSAELTPATFDKLYKLFRPDPKQSFESIPWQTSLWTARQQAATEDKPIVLWSGDPLPLGIT